MQAHPPQILKMPRDSFTNALGRLDPASRALLDLSLRRGMRPEEIADLLGADAETVVASRDHALERVAADVGLAGDTQLDELREGLAELPSAAWAGAARGNGNHVANGANGNGRNGHGHAALVEPEAVEPEEP